MHFSDSSKAAPYYSSKIRQRILLEYALIIYELSVAGNFSTASSYFSTAF